MYICKDCHKKRQERKALESQPIQWTDETLTITRIKCPECGRRQEGKYFQYLNAFELAQELEEAREKLKHLEVPPVFPLSFYSSAQDLLNCRLIKGATVVDYQESEEILRYTAELEEVLSSCL